MGMYTKGSGKMIRLRGTGSIITKMERVIPDSGKMMFNTVMGLKAAMMEVFTMGNYD